MRHKYRICIDVEHFSREECIRKFEELLFQRKLAGWKEGVEGSSGEYPFAKTSVAIGPIAPSVLDRLDRIEQEIANRLGGLSEDAA